MIWDPHPLLMVDANLVASETRTSLVREEAFKYTGNPLMRLEDKTLTLGGKTRSIVIELITRQDGRYRIWYQMRGAKPGLKPGPEYNKEAFIGYAESDDGIHFKPLHLKQIEFNGSRNNNIVPFPAPSGQKVRISGLLHDPLDADYPFKCIYYRPGKGVDLEPGVLSRTPDQRDRDFWLVWGIGRSKDGLSWEHPQHRHTLVRANPEHAKLHRALDGGLVISDQMSSPIAQRVTRSVKGWITYDLETAHRIPDFLFTLPPHMCRVFREFSGPNWDGTFWVQPHLGLVCARKGPTIVGLNGYLYGCLGAETFAQVADTGLCISSTGVDFQEVWPFRPFIPRGHRGSWDFGMIGQREIVDDGDQTRFYYIGGDVGNFASTYLPGMASIPRDRYGYRIIKGYRNYDKRPATGTIILKPLSLPDRPCFAVNVSHVTKNRTIRLEIADENGKPITGYTSDACHPVTQDGLKQPVRWEHDRTGEELSGRTIQIRAELHSPDCGTTYHDSPRLYAIYTA